MFESLAVLLVIGQVGQLMRVVVDLKEFLGRAWVGEDLLLVRVGLAGGMSLPQFVPCRVVIIRFVTKVRLVGEVVADI